MVGTRKKEFLGKTHEVNGLQKRQDMLNCGQLHSIAVLELLWASYARSVILYTRELLNPKYEYF